MSRPPTARPEPPLRRPRLAVWLFAVGVAELWGLVAAPAASAATAALPAASVPELLAAAERGRAEVDGKTALLERARKAQAQREQQAAQATLEIEKLKAQPPGVARDLALQNKLAQAQAQATELSAEAAALHQQEEALRSAQKRLLVHCDRLLAADDSALGAAQRLAWLRVRTTQVEALLGPDRTQAVRSVVQSETRPGDADPTREDDPRSLHERADLLRDSADKLSREIERLRARGEEISRRQRLRERAARVDEDLFAEQAAARRPSRRSAGGDSVTLAADTAEKATAPQAPGSPTIGAASPLPSTSSTSTRGLDPATLDILQRVESGGDPQARLLALQRAQQELQTLTDQLLRRATRLEQRATELSRQK